MFSGEFTSAVFSITRSPPIFFYVKSHFDLSY